VVGVVTSQSRTAIIASVVALVAFVALVILSRQAARLIVGLAVASAVVFAAVSIVTRNDNSALYRYRSITPNQIVNTTYNYKSATISSIPDYAFVYPLGAGIGSVGPAGGALGAAYVPLDGESEFTFLIIETGVLGLIVMLALHLRLLGLAVRRIRRETDRDVQLLLAALAAPLFAVASGWIAGITTTSTPNAPYLWFSAGVLSYWLVHAPALRVTTRRPSRGSP
jgi:O-antigen ligase